MSATHRTLPTTPSFDQEIEEIALFLKTWVGGASDVTKAKINKIFSTRSSSRGWSGADTISRRADPPTSGSLVSGQFTLMLAVWFGGGLDGLGVPISFGHLMPRWRLVLSLSRGGGGHRGGALGDEQMKTLQLTTGWKQQLVIRAGWAQSPLSASVRLKNAGQSF